MKQKAPAKKRKCGAKTKTTGLPCEKSPMTNGRCRLHGGKTPSGTASPHYKHGLYSRYLPKPLRTTFDSVAEDPKLNELSTEIQLITALLERRLSLLSSSIGDDDAMDLAEEEFNALDDALFANDIKAAKMVAKSLRKTILAARREYQIFDEVKELIAQKEKLVRAESFRLDKLGGNVPVGQVIVYINKVEKAMAVIPDAEIRAAVVGEFKRLLGPELRSGLGGEEFRDGGPGE